MSNQCALCTRDWERFIECTKEGLCALHLIPYRVKKLPIYVCSKDHGEKSFIPFEDAKKGFVHMFRAPNFEKPLIMVPKTYHPDNSIAEPSYKKRRPEPLLPDYIETSNENENINKVSEAIGKALDTLCEEEEKNHRELTAKKRKWDELQQEVYKCEEDIQRLEKVAAKLDKAKQCLYGAENEVDGKK